MGVAAELPKSKEILLYLCPQRLISFDGFVNYEGRRFGVPYWYRKKICRVNRRDYVLTIYSDDMEQTLAKHDVTWSRKDMFCRDQYLTSQPEEFPTMPVKAKLFQVEPTMLQSGFEKFNFEEGLQDE